ncbi:MAG: leucine-rich repeat domain-containing protein [Chloroflexi bacterium]|nr:leucine-rich repeat domain-containing protein [Chloroflexota bacterium]
MTSEGFAFAPPIWSPDGKHIALYTIDKVDDKYRKPLTLYTVSVPEWRMSEIGRIPLAWIGDLPPRPREIPPRPSWSPDGQRIAFAAARGTVGSEWGVFTANADGTDRRLVIGAGEIDAGGRQIESIDLSFRNRLDRIRQVEWSPDGSEILLTSDLPYLLLVSPDGTKHRWLTPPLDERPVPGLVAWSPDGSRIAIHSPERFLVTMDRDGGDPRILYEGYLHLPDKAHGDPADCSAGVVVPRPDANPGLVQDCEVLLRSLAVLAGNARFRWDPSLPITSWAGVVIETSTSKGLPLRVRGLRLEKVGLFGSIPPSLGDLGALESLNLAGNRLTGEIPAELGQLAKLQDLNLSENPRLAGGIPPELGGLTSLRILNLRTNRLTGVVPPESGQLTELTRLDLSSNELRGPIPPQLGQLANLTELDLGFNQLTGAIPPELGQLANLTRLDLSHNFELTGGIPPELGQLASLTELNLSSNQLTGTIPPELGQLANLTKLKLASNQLTGAIPPELGQLGKLQELSLPSNRLTGAIPPEFNRLTDLTWLGLWGNRMTGCIPRTVWHAVDYRSEDNRALPVCERE